MPRLPKTYHEHFRLKKKRGRWYVLYRGDEAHPRSTGIPVDTRFADENESAAVNWAYANLYQDKPKSITLEEYAHGFFDPETCKWTRRNITGRRQRQFNSLYLSTKRGYLKNYIIPRFRSVPLHMITADMIDDWLEELDSVQYGTPLSGSSLDKVLHTLRIILQQAKRDGLVKENAAYDIEPFDTTKGSRKREPFTRAEVRKLYPGDLQECVRIWGTMQWYSYFLMMYTGGLRPQEVSAFEYRDWIQEEHGAIFHQRLDTNTMQILEGLKTVKNGMTVKAVPFSDRLEEVLRGLVFRGTPTTGLFFLSENGRPIGSETANKHFKASAKRASVELGKRTQYSLRHTYYTELLKEIPERDVEQLAGHTTLRKEYDHRKGIDFLRRRQSIRAAVNGLTA